MEENKDLIDKLFARVEEKVKEHEIAHNLSKGSRIRHRNGRVLDVYLLALSDNTAAISFVDTKTRVEACTVDTRDKNLRYLDLTYEKACEIYDEILDRNEIVTFDLKRH